MSWMRQIYICVIMFFEQNNLRGLKSEPKHHTGGEDRRPTAIHHIKSLLLDRMILLWYLLFTITPDFLNFTIHENISPTSTWTLQSSLVSVSLKSVNFRRCLSNVLSCRPNLQRIVKIVNFLSQLLWAVLQIGTYVMLIATAVKHYPLILQIRLECARERDLKIIYYWTVAPNRDPLQSLNPLSNQEFKLVRCCLWYPNRILKLAVEKWKGWYSE
jgi:hypothetical protein